MLFFFLFTLTLFGFVNANFFCELCTEVISDIENYVVDYSLENLEDYLTQQCDQSSGFWEYMCDHLVEFGIKEVAELIMNQEPEQVCTAISIL